MTEEWTGSLTPVSYHIQAGIDEKSWWAEYLYYADENFEGERKLYQFAFLFSLSILYNLISYLELGHWKKMRIASLMLKSLEDENQY